MPPQGCPSHRPRNGASYTRLQERAMDTTLVYRVVTLDLVQRELNKVEANARRRTKEMSNTKLKEEWA